MNQTMEKTDTRASLIEAGLHFFGRQGFEGTSTRQLAARANTNVASIAYHFGGKAGLRAACLAAVVDRVAEVMDGSDGIEVPTSQAQAAAQIERLIRAFVSLIVGSPEAQAMVAFLLREISGSGESAKAVYSNFVEPRHTALCSLWAAATGRSPDDPQVKLAVFSLIGQVVYFRIASPFVSRRMGWPAIGTGETGQITQTVIANLHDAIERHRL